MGSRAARRRAASACAYASSGSSSISWPASTRWPATISARSLGRLRSSARTARCRDRVSTSAGRVGSFADRARPGRAGSRVGRSGGVDRDSGLRRVWSLRSSRDSPLRGLAPDRTRPPDGACPPARTGPDGVPVAGDRPAHPRGACPVEPPAPPVVAADASHPNGDALARRSAATGQSSHAENRSQTACFRHRRLQSVTGFRTQKHLRGGHEWPPLRCDMSGDVLVSHTVPRAVPSALKGLTSGFGMEPGVSLSP